MCISGLHGPEAHPPHDDRSVGSCVELSTGIMERRSRGCKIVAAAHGTCTVCKRAEARERRTTTVGDTCLGVLNVSISKESPKLSRCLCFRKFSLGSRAPYPGHQSTSITVASTPTSDARTFARVGKFHRDSEVRACLAENLLWWQRSDMKARPRSPPCYLCAGMTKLVPVLLRSGALLPARMLAYQQGRNRSPTARVRSPSICRTHLSRKASRHLSRMSPPTCYCIRAVSIDRVTEHIRWQHRSGWPTASLL